MENKILNFYKKWRIHPDPDMFTVFFIVSLLSLSLGIYNNYQIRNGSFVQNNVIQGKNVKSAKNIIKEIRPDAPRIGNQNAKVSVIVFEDFQCPFCKRFHDETIPQLKKEYVDTGKVLLVHQDLAFLGIESNASAEAGRCAFDQGKFGEYQDALYQNQTPAHNAGGFSDDNLKKIAQKLGLNMVEFNGCFDGQKYKNAVNEARVFADTYGITSTPTIVVNGVIIKGARPYTEFKALIDKELKN